MVRWGSLFHFQGTGSFEVDLNLVEAFQTLGVRMVQLTYNIGRIMLATDAKKPD
ncbi:membrane dipeptidase [Mesorhizobium opportunistum]|uniref:membrane dipeptidase n=1 Tax=Mesorhizobium opportunistum TaxID=593909 RepID=UPI003337197E